jgi:hypothetical protein
MTRHVGDDTRTRRSFVRLPKSPPRFLSPRADATTNATCRHNATLPAATNKTSFRNHERSLSRRFGQRPSVCSVKIVAAFIASYTARVLHRSGHRHSLTPLAALFLRFLLPLPMNETGSWPWAALVLLRRRPPALVNKVPLRRIGSAMSARTQL